MSLGFVVSEGLAGISRAKLAFSISVMTLMLTISLIGLGVLGVDNILAYLHSVQAEFDVELFFDTAASDDEITGTAELVANYPGVSGFKFVSKAEAATVFQAEFGEDIMNILEENPLPASLQVRFEPLSRNEVKIGQFIHDMEIMAGVDEVVFRMDIFNRLQTLLRLVYILAAVLLFILIFVAVFLTSNTIRLMILARFEFIETIRLLGATDFMLKAPFFVEGAVQGLLGGLFAIGIIYGFETLAIRFLGITLFTRLLDYPYLVGGLLFLGITLAALGSLRAVRRFLQFVV